MKIAKAVVRIKRKATLFQTTPVAGNPNTRKLIQQSTLLVNPSASKSKTTAVREHERHVSKSPTNPDGMTTVHRHLRRLPGTALDPDEIASTFKNYDRKNLVLPTKKKITDFKNSDDYDDFIAVWTDFFNKKMELNPPLDPDVIKALIASESRFELNPENPLAFGIAQITKATLKIVQDPSGEARTFIFHKVRQKDLMNPSIAIPIAIRWLSRKKALAKSKLGREPNAEEIILEYKGLLKSSTTYKDNALASFRKYYALLKSK